MASEMFDPARHQPLTSTGWDPERARGFVAEVIEDAERGFDAGALWPAHPLDGDLGASGPRTGIYLGAAGVCWALAELGAPRWREEARGLVARYRAQPDTGSRVPSYFLGEVGVLAVAGEHDDELFALIESNISNPALEPLWGSSGTMLAALFRWRQTGDVRWRELWLRNARWLMERWEYEEDAGGHLWTQDLYGEIVRLTGAGHGFAGNAFALLSGIELLEEAEQAVVVSRASATLLATARRRDGLASWLPHVGMARRGREPILVQWCHGAPGMITSLGGGLPRAPEVDAVLAEGGELVWRAGPLTKGANLCHGTAGNGYAFLTLFRRGGEELWLDRARAFAMHAIEQVREARQRFGVGRYSLWTGDLGVALFVADCCSGVAAMGMPSLARL